MKERFIESMIEIVEISTEDIITTSPTGGGNTELPDLPISINDNDPFN